VGYLSGIRAIAALAVVVVGALVSLVPTDAALAIGINPIYCGKGVGPISAPAAGRPTQALSAGANPYRVVATYYYKDRKQPQDKRIMRLGDSRWGFTHIRLRRGWSTVDTYVIVGCVLTYGEPVGQPQGSSYSFKYRFPRAMTPDQDLAGREYLVVYQTAGARGEPKGVITAFESGVIG
jgi:hypothetical protein